MCIEDKISSIIKLEPNSTYVVTVDDASNEEVSVVSDELSINKFNDFKFIVTTNRVTFQRIDNFTTYGVKIDSASKDDINTIIDVLSKHDALKNYQFIITPNNIINE